MVPGTRLKVSGTWCQAPGTWDQVPGSRYQVPGTMYKAQVPATPRTCYQVPGTTDDHRVPCIEFGQDGYLSTRFVVSCTRCLIRHIPALYHLIDPPDLPAYPTCPLKAAHPLALPAHPARPPDPMPPRRPMGLLLKGKGDRTYTGTINP